MTKVKSEAEEPLVPLGFSMISEEHDSGDESPTGEEEEAEAPKTKPKHSVKGTLSCPMCPKVWGFPWELRRHVITHYNQVRQVAVQGGAGGLIQWFG